MKIEVRRAEYKDVQGLRELYRHEANCQIVTDSALMRAIADPYLIFVNDRIGGYGALWNTYPKGRLMEFHTLPDVRGMAATLFRELLIVSQATHIEAQTNMPLMLMMLYDHAREITTESILFQDAFTTRLVCPGGVFRRATYDDAAAMSPPQEDIGDWVLEFDGAVVANGGYLRHYNPPYGDIFMAVSESRRGRGFGSYLVQELKQVCYEAGSKPSARCNPGNLASRRTLQKAGLLPCGRLLAGEVAPLA